MNSPVDQTFSSWVALIQRKHTLCTVCHLRNSLGPVESVPSALAVGEREQLWLRSWGLAYHCLLPPGSIFEESIGLEAGETASTMTERRKMRISMDPPGNAWWMGPWRRQQERCGVVCRAERTDRARARASLQCQGWWEARLAGVDVMAWWGKGGQCSMCVGRGSGSRAWLNKLSSPQSMTMWQVSLKRVMSLNGKSLEWLHFRVHGLKIIKTIMGEILYFWTFNKYLTILLWISLVVMKWKWMNLCKCFWERAVNREEENSTAQIRVQFTGRGKIGLWLFLWKIMQ